MMLTTMGSEYWPRTVEGRALALLLALYAFTVFGYVTATLATFFIEQDRTRESPLPARRLAQLHEEVAALRAELKRLRAGDVGSGI
jgi:voltage-gated potassium channel